MDNKIKKSLIDKTIIETKTNPRIIVNERSKNVKDSIINNLISTDRFDIAVSYVSWSGFSLIYEYFKKFNSGSRFIVTIEGFVTDPKSLEELLNLDISVKVYNPTIDDRGFHLKSYLFENENESTILIGSSNISARAFGLAHEMITEIKSNNNGYILDEYKKTFNDLWNDPISIDLTKEFVEEYRKNFNINQKIKRKLSMINYSSNNIKPNYMQEKALRELSECREISDRGLVIAATGTGKTYLSAFDIKNANANKVLFLVHNRLILTSAIETYKNVFKDKKILELSSKNINDFSEYDFIFTTDKTSYNLLVNKASEDYFDYIIYDEAHKIGENTKYDEIINYFKPKFTLGLTATPERTKNPKYLFEVFKYSIPYEIRLLEALDNELVSPFTYYGLNLDNKLLNSNEEFDYYEVAAFLDKQIKEKGYYGNKLRAITFCTDIKEAKELSKYLNSIGYVSVSAVSLESTNEEIEEYIKGLKSSNDNSIEIICTVNKFNEGVDIPDINTIIMLRNTESSIIYLQQLGRGLRRTYDPNKYVTVFDIIGNSKNSYTIAEVLSLNQTVDKRKLLEYTNNEFKTVSPFVNVIMEKQVMDNIIKSISYNFKVKQRIKEKFRDELLRYKEIPALKEMYLNPVFNELDLLQLLHKNFFDPFDTYYVKKYGTILDSFLSGFFTLISQFVFRGYDNKTLKDYARILKGEKITNDTLRQILFPKDFEDGRITSTYSYYYKKGNNYPKAFLYSNNKIYINEDIIDKLKELNAYELFKEHIELVEELSKKQSYEMKLFDLVDKGEFLFNHGAKDCYMNVSGERIDKDKKRIFSMVNITEKESKYNNYIIDNQKVVYYTKASNTKEQAIEKINMLVNDKYEFYLFAQFPHLGYESTTYFNLDKVRVDEISEVRNVNGKWNHRVVLEVKDKIKMNLNFQNR